MTKNIHISTLVNIILTTLISFLIIMMAVYYLQLIKVESHSKLITSLRVPTAKASATMNTNINASLASLRGWMLIKDENFISSRRQAWQIIHQQERAMLKLSTLWTNPDNVGRLVTISNLLNKLESEQLTIELIAHSPENVASVQILLDDAVPLASKITDNITKMIDYSKTQPSSNKRQDILATMADLRGSFTLSLAEIRAYLLSADVKFQASFKKQWQRNEKSFTKIKSLNSHLSAFEKDILTEIGILREKFLPLPDKMFKSRMSDEWNKANHTLKTTAIVTSQEINKLLSLMVADQNRLLEEDTDAILQQTSQLKALLIIFLVVSLLVWIFATRTINLRFNQFQRNLDGRNLLVDQNVMMATLSEEGEIITISNSLCRRLKNTQEDFIGTQSNFFHSSKDDIDKNEELLKLLKTGARWQGEFLRTEGEEEIWFASHIIPTEDDNSAYTIILEDITARKQFEEVSLTDKLTALYNRRKFDDVMDKEIMIAKRQKKQLSFAILDIDFFKKYNDHYGHPAGDAALVRVASCLKSSFNRPDDYVFRLGGEEFGIIFSGLDKKQSLDLLERAKQNIENLEIEHTQSDISNILTISIGVKVCCEGDVFQRENIYIEADGALYKAKETRNTVTLA